MTDLDVDAQITIARDDLRLLAEAIVRCWSIDLDRLRKGAPPGAIEEWEVESGMAAASHPSLRRPSAGIERPVPWVPPGRHTVEHGYVEATRELARAHERLLSTDWPADDSDVGFGWTPGMLIDVPADRARTVPRAEALRACRSLSLGLEWARGQDLRPPERSAVVESCDHARAALRHIPDGIRCPSRPPKVRRCARSGCEGPDGRPRILAPSDGRVCSTCRKRDQRLRQAG